MKNNYPKSGDCERVFIKHSHCLISFDRLSGSGRDSPGSLHRVIHCPRPVNRLRQRSVDRRLETRRGRRGESRPPPMELSQYMVCGRSQRDCIGGWRVPTVTSTLFRNQAPFTQDCHSLNSAIRLFIRATRSRTPTIGVFIFRRSGPAS
jgi:hypothetical protein